MGFLDLYQRLSTIPTAPYREKWLRERVLAELDGIRGLTVKSDQWGNVAARLTRGREGAHPIAFVAHLDHPGFHVAGPVNKEGHLPVVFDGGVDDEFFPEGKIRLFRSPDDAGIPAQIVSMSERSNDARRNRTGFVLPEGDASNSLIGMWDLEPWKVEGDLLHGRAVDDLGGVCAMLETLTRLAKSDEPTDTIMLFTLAEETGFRGALLLCMDPNREELLPQSTRVISVETSSALPNVPVGGGAVIRVGDRSTIFNPVITAELEFAAKPGEGEERRPPQRALMDGGSCEATAFNAFGYRAGGVCLPLGNYHNMNKEKSCIEEEYISLSDAEDLVTMMERVSLIDTTSFVPHAKLRERLAEYAREAREHWGFEG